MKLYLVSQEHNCNWDTFDAVVVAAESYHRAKLFSIEVIREREWAEYQHLTAKYIGQAQSKSETIVCASFNAG